METEVAIDNADVGNIGYLTNAKVRGKLKTTEKASTTGMFIWQDGADNLGSLNGYRAGVSNQVRSDLTKGSSSGICSAIFYGNWADLIIGQWSGIDLLVDPYTGGTAGTVRVIGLQDVDIAVRQPSSFCYLADALTT
jgi:HK97 family phage major capsid protein